MACHFKDDFYGKKYEFNIANWYSEFVIVIILMFKDDFGNIGAVWIWSDVSWNVYKKAAWENSFHMWSYA